MTTIQPSEWTELLKQARSALSQLRADDLEELQSRAEAANVPVLGPQVIDRLNTSAIFAASLNRERKLLKDLLQATRRNMDVFVAPRFGGAGIERESEGVRWVR